MDRDALRDRVDSYMHRYDAQNTEIETFIEDARQTIGRDLRCQHNLKSATVAMSSGTGTIPADFQEALVFYGPDGQRLQYVTPDYAATFREESGTPEFFTVDTVIRAYPKADDDYTLHYFHTPAELDSGGAENEVLTNLPLVYLYACLMLGAIWVGDGQFLKTMQGLYDAEVSRENAKFRKSRRTSDAVMQGAQGFAAAPVSGV